MDVDAMLLSLHDREAELTLLAAMLREPIAVLEALEDISFEAADLYHEDLKLLFDVVAYVANGPHERCPLVEVYLELRRRGAKKGAAGRLADVFCHKGFCDREDEWELEVKLDNTRRCYEAWYGLCAAERVQHLSARRQAASAAMELLREAQHPSGPAAEIRDGIDAMGGYE